MSLVVPGMVAGYDVTMRALFAPGFLAVALVLAGCSSAGGVDGATPAPGEAGGSAGSGGENAGGSEAGGAAGSGVAVAGSGGGGSGGGGGFQGCYSVDVLFVIDNSGSMGSKQQAFPKFAETMKQKLSGAVSYHVGVVTSDDYFANKAGCQSIGDLVVKTGGPESSNQDCGPFSSGKNYLDGGDPKLSERFQCVARVGAGGSDNERVMRGLLNAVDPKRNAAGACNEGFARPDSLLILVIIADEDDAADGDCDPFQGPCMTGSGGTSTDWYNELLKHRGGVADNIVALSLVNDKGLCAGSIGARLKGFTLKFKNRAVGDVCTLDYGKFFDEALPIIGEACEKYTPIK
jgi:hypothetical protein